MALVIVDVVLRAFKNILASVVGCGDVGSNSVQNERYTRFEYSGPEAAACRQSEVRTRAATHSHVTHESAQVSAIA